MSIAKSNSLISQRAWGLAQLLHWRWSLPILRVLWLEQGAKFVLLVNRLHISRDALSRTLVGLIELGYIEKNPGYGHPMRPEYLLSVEGEAIAPPLTRLLQHLQDSNLEDVALNKWSLPILWLVAANQTRFSQLQTILQGVSPRALTLTLSDLEQVGLLERHGEKRPTYTLSPSGQQVWEQLNPLAETLCLDPT